MRVTLLVAVAWVGINLLVFAGRGFERIASDSQIRQASGLGEKRALCWDRPLELPPGSPKPPPGSGLVDQVRSFEKIVAQVKERATQPKGVMVLTPTGSTVFASIARHELFPVPAILVRKQVEVAEVQAATGADLGLRVNQRGLWRTFEPGN